MWTIGLLLVSNVFMTFAWYGHLKFTQKPLWVVVLASWGIAFFEYCFQVPANRLGHVNGWEPAQLKIVQEVITMVVFMGFSVWYLDVQIKWNHLLAFVLIIAAVALVFKDGMPEKKQPVDAVPAVASPHPPAAAPAEPGAGETKR